MSMSGTTVRHRPRGVRLMRTACAAAVAIGAVTAPLAHASASQGFHVSGSKLLDAKGKPFVMRGVNVLNASSAASTPQALTDIAATGANSVRLTVTGAPNADGSTVKSLQTIIAQCKKLKLVCVFVDQDTSGYGEAGSTAITLTAAVAYWKSVKPAFAGQEAYTIIDIGELPYGSTKAKEWTGEAVSAVKAMRAAGIKQTLMVTGPDYGEDISGTMRNNAPAVLAADPKHNVVFSVAMYANYYDLPHVRSYVDAYLNRNLALVVGQFSWAYLPWGVWNAGSGGADGPDEASIMAYTQQKGVGWAAFAWSGSSPDKGYDDMVLENQGSAQTPWYGTVVTGPNGTKQTSHPASVY